MGWQREGPIHPERVEWTPELKQRQKESLKGKKNIISESELNNNPNMQEEWDAKRDGPINLRLYKEVTDEMERKINALNIENVELWANGARFGVTFFNSKGSEKKHSKEFGFDFALNRNIETTGWMVFDKPEAAYANSTHAMDAQEFGTPKTISFGTGYYEYALSPDKEITIIYNGLWKPEFMVGVFAKKTGKETKTTFAEILESIKLVGQELNSLQKWKQILKR
jgi:hypothetical protein